MEDNKNKKYQTTAARASMKPTKKLNGFVALVIIALIMALSYFLFGSGSKKDAEIHQAQTAAASITSVDQLVQASTDSLKKAFPGHNDYDWDKEANILTLKIWIDGSSQAAEYAKAGDKEALRGWKTLTDNLTESCAAWQNNFDKAGADVMVVMQMLNPENHKLALASARRGKLTYDCVSGLLK